ncbi:MAG TPA: hypothetical protein VF057_11580 [Thermoanaerobaculia bacterium]
MKRTSIALALLLTVACASTPLTSSSTDASGAAAPGLPSLKNAPDYILLSSPNQIRAWDFGNPVGVRAFHLRGVSTNYGFKAIGDVQGGGQLCADSTHWLSLSDLTVYSTSEKAPQAPYLAGCKAGSVFQPSTRTITQ